MRLLFKVWVVAVVCAPAVGFSASSGSASYVFDYSIVSFGGGVSSSAAYEIVAVTDEGGSPGVSASAMYQLEPTLGVSGSGVARVGDWELY